LETYSLYKTPIGAICYALPGLNLVGTAEKFFPMIHPGKKAAFEGTIIDGR
jgi:hypothetical protein